MNPGNLKALSDLAKSHVKAKGMLHLLCKEITGPLSWQLDKHSAAKASGITMMVADVCDQLETALVGVLKDIDKITADKTRGAKPSGTRRFRAV